MHGQHFLNLFSMIIEIKPIDINMKQSLSPSSPDTEPLRLAKMHGKDFESDKVDNKN